jgi:ligand-binding sensor domain-containing protein
MDGLVSNYVFSITESSNGSIWFGTNKGVSILDKNNLWASLTTTDGLIDDHVSTIIETHDGEMWFGTPSGISKYDGKKWVSYTSIDGLASPLINELLFINDKVWAATEGGVSYLDGNTWVTYDSFDGLASNSVNSLAVDDEGNVWFATIAGVSKMKPRN